MSPPRHRRIAYVRGADSAGTLGRGHGPPLGGPRLARDRVRGLAIGGRPALTGGRRRRRTRWSCELARGRLHRARHPRRSAEASLAGHVRDGAVVEAEGTVHVGLVPASGPLVPRGTRLGRPRLRRVRPSHHDPLAVVDTRRARRTRETAGIAGRVAKATDGLIDRMAWSTALGRWLGDFLIGDLARPAHVTSRSGGRLLADRPRRLGRRWPRSADIRLGAGWPPSRHHISRPVTCPGEQLVRLRAPEMRAPSTTRGHR